MSNATRGTHLERVVMDKLHDRGWVVIRSAGSHGPADVAAIKPGVVLLVQSKVTASSFGSREWQELWDMAQKSGSVPILAYRPSPRTVAFARLMGPRALRERAAGLLQNFEP